MQAFAICVYGFNALDMNIIKYLVDSRYPSLGFWLWLYGLYGLYSTIRSNKWLHLSISVGLSLHVRVPCPLGQIPPLMDATTSSFLSRYPLHVCVSMIFVSYIIQDFDFLIPSALFFVKFIRLQYCEKKLRVLLLNARSFGEGFASGPSELPFLARLHPYLLSYCGSDLSGGISIVRKFDADNNVDVDVWNNSAIGGEKPVVIFIHGGGWKGGGSRFHSQVQLLHKLAVQGNIVVAVNYRKDRWPEHLHDCISAFLWTVHNIYKSGGNPQRMTICGASAGGHLACLLYQHIFDCLQSSNQTSRKNEDVPLQHYRINSDRSSRMNLEPKSFHIDSMVLFYPAIDPADDTKQTCWFPFTFPLLHIRFSQSLMSWFFERVVLVDKKHLWPSASPLRALTSNQSLRESWPRTLVIHGDLDSIVPIEHSYALLHFLSSPLSDSHPPPGLHSEQDPLKDSSAPYTETTFARSSASESTSTTAIDESARLCLQSLDIGAIDRGWLWNDARTIRTSKSLGFPQGDAVQNKHSMLVAEGLKHSFECAGGPILDHLNELVLLWMAN